MTASMIEAVARAMFETNPTRNRALQWTDAATPRERYRKQARAAIEAMLEPSEEMTREGADFLPVTPGGATNAAAGRVYEAMISAALKEKP